MQPELLERAGSSSSLRGQLRTLAYECAFSLGTDLLTYYNLRLQVHMLFGGKTHNTAQSARVTVGCVRGSGFSGVGERAAQSLDRVSRRRAPGGAAGAVLSSVISASLEKFAITNNRDVDPGGGRGRCVPVSP